MAKNEFALACENCKQLRAFLYCAVTNNIGDLTCRVNPDDAELQRYKEKRHRECILSTNDADAEVVGNPDAIQQLANSLKNQTGLIEELKVGREEARNDKKGKLITFMGHQVDSF